MNLTLQAHSLNARGERPGRYVLYWMQAAQRVAYNPALEAAIALANERGLPVVVCLGLTAHFPAANARHYRFLLEGLADVRARLTERGIPLVARLGEPDRVAADLSQGAALVVVDRGELRVQHQWYERAAAAMACPLLQVETNTVVPLAVASDHEEYAARTLRPKIQRCLAEYLSPLPEEMPRHSGLGIDLEMLDVARPEPILAALGVDQSVPPGAWVGGTAAARAELARFLSRGIDHYAEERNDPNATAVSNQSAYLHFGQISPLEIALAVAAHGGPGAEAYLEELIVRRELAANMVRYNPGYDCYESVVPRWSQETLAQHVGDPRPARYTRAELESGQTDDPYWNAAQQEMVCTGKMHGYLRMYWGKKLLEWSATPQEAFDLALALNDRWELDGRDPNGYAGVAWCFGKHDRPWPEHPVFGNVRLMNANGLRRKFDVDAYARRVAALPMGRAAAGGDCPPAS